MCDAISNFCYNTVNNYFSFEENTQTWEERAYKVGIIALKILSYLTIVIPLAMLIIREILGWGDGNLEISPKQLARIKEVAMRDMYTLQGDDKISILTQRNVWVYVDQELPGFVFKRERPCAPKSSDSIQERCRKIAFARRVCKSHQLGLMVIPETKCIQISVKGRVYKLLIEKKLDFESQLDIDVEEDYNRLSPQLNETVRQLATFILKTGFSDVEWRNVPLLKGEDSEGRKQVGLIDLEEMTDSVMGIFGNTSLLSGPRRGLIRLLSSEEQMDAVIQLANEHGVYPNPEREDIDTIKRDRMQEVENNRRRTQFYQDQDILTIEDAKKPIAVDFDSLGLPERFRTTCRDIVALINQAIASEIEEVQSAASQRLVFLLQQTYAQEILGKLQGQGKIFHFQRCWDGYLVQV